MRQVTANREQLVKRWQYHLVSAMRTGELTGHPCNVQARAYVAPRVGMLLLYCGFDAVAVHKRLSENNAGKLRQTIPWRFAQSPQVLWYDRFVRVEVPWPEGLANTAIRLSDVSGNPKDSNAWAVGKSVMGETIVAWLGDDCPHLLISGTTGSGKTVALRNAALQLSAKPDNKLVLLDGKRGKSLKAVEHLSGVVGPCCTDGESVRRALGWVAAKMWERCAASYNTDRIVVIFDEFHRMTGDKVIAALLSEISEHGREVGIHLLCATQHPNLEAFGTPEARRCIAASRIALRVVDRYASEMAVGGSLPRADELLGRGDMYAILTGQAVHRVQGIFVEQADIAKKAVGEAGWMFRNWPVYDAEALGQPLPQNGQFKYEGEEIGIAVESAAEGEGRGRFTDRMEDAGFGRPGGGRQEKLRNLGQGAYDQMVADGYDVCKRPQRGAEGVVPVPVIPAVW